MGNTKFEMDAKNDYIYVSILMIPTLNTSYKFVEGTEPPVCN